MIVVIVQSDKIMVKGHANYAEPGKDIVCAGVSTMVQTLIRAIEELTVDTTKAAYIIKKQHI